MSAIAAPRWLKGLWLVLIVGIVVVRFVDTGDMGLKNALTMMQMMLLAISAFLWATLSRAFAVRTRLALVAGVIVFLVAFAMLFEFQGFQSDMVPSFRLARNNGALGEAVRGAAVVDLALTSPTDFSGYLGTNRDLRVEGVDLARDWSTTPPQPMWRRAVGDGWGGFAIVNGYAATLEERDGRETATLYNLQTGDLVWETDLDAGFFHVLGGRGPRSTPTIYAGRVYVVTAHGKLFALAGADGSVVWSRDLLDDYGISAEEELTDIAYGRPTSPLLHDGRVIVGVGGSRRQRVSVAAFDAATGDKVWEAGARNVSMASPGLGTIGGREQILMVNENWISGHDADTGEVLWEFEWPGITAADSNVSQAIAVGGDQVFISKGYGSGAALYDLRAESDGRFTATQVWHRPAVLRTKLTNAVIKDGHAYGLSEGILECVDLATGERVWKGGRYRHGQLLLVGDDLLVLTEDGEVVMVEATPGQSNNVLGEFQALNGLTWNTLALSGDVLLVRNGREAAAYRLPLR